LTKNFVHGSSRKKKHRDESKKGRKKKDKNITGPERPGWTKSKQ